MCAELTALLWDVDGTLAETERDGHRVAFNRAFEAAGVPWRWSECRYGELLAVTGGRERLMFDMQHQALAPAGTAERRELASQLHALKNRFYADIVARGELSLRAGVRQLIHDCVRAQIPMAIVTTTSRENVETLLSVQLGADWSHTFVAVVTAQEAPKKKPDPQAYHLALRQLGMSAQSVLAIEDSPAGVRAATAARIPVVVTRSYYFPDNDVSAALAVGPSLDQPQEWLPAANASLAGGTGRIDLRQLQCWKAAACQLPEPHCRVNPATLRTTTRQSPSGRA